MPTAGFLLGLSVLYLGLLFAAATWADRRAAAGRSVARNALVYKLSLAVYCSAWTFYGGVGLASREGLAFLPIYLGPTLTALLFPFVLQKVLRVAKAQGTTSIADFVAARYGKSGLLAGLVAVIAVVAAVPYIALQLQALDASVEALLPAGGAVLAARLGADIPPLVALVLALFCVLFGTRTIDATERHEGLVVAVALESLVKLVALLAVGAFVTWGLSGGLADLGARYVAAGHGPALTIGGRMGYADWFLLTLVSALPFLVLPRQLRVAVTENRREDHAGSASWLLPLYLLLISLFMLPVAMAGALGGRGDPDLFVLRLPLDAGRPALALLAYLGGLSASAAMVVVEGVALSTMVSNDLVMPVLLRLELLGLRRRGDLSGLILGVRRGAILLLVGLGYACSRTVAPRYGLASIGFVAFAGAAQFAPPILAGLYWRGAGKAGAVAGLLAGTAIWAYTLVLPALAEAGLLADGFVTRGPFGLGLLRPHALFGLEGLGATAHAVLWSLSANSLCLVLGSLLVGPGSLERVQAALFVEAEPRQGPDRLWRGEAWGGGGGGGGAGRGGARGGAGGGPARAADPLPRQGAGRGGLRRRRPPAGLRRRGLRPGPPRAGAADRVAPGARDRGRLGPDHGGLGRAGRGDRARGPDGDPGRGVPAHGLQPAARAEVGGARARDGRAQGGLRPAAPARPAQGRVRGHGEPRAAHAADLDPLVLGNPARHAGPVGGGAAALPRHRGPGVGPADAPRQRRARPVEDRGRPHGLARRRLRPARSPGARDRGHERRHGRAPGPGRDRSGAGPGDRPGRP